METRRANRVIFVSYLAVAIILLLAYILEVVKGARSIGYYFLFFAIIAIPLTLTSIIYFKNKESQKYGVLAAWGYFMMYCFVLASNTYPIECTYIFPIVVVLPILHNFKFTLAYSIAVFVANVANIIFKAITAYSPDWLTQAEIQAAAVLLVMFFTCFMSKVDTDMNKYKLKTIKDEQDKALEKNDQITEMAKQLSAAASDIAEQINEATDMLSTNTESMNQVCDGTNITAESVQTQMEVIETLAEGIEEFSNISSLVGKNVENTISSVQTGDMRMKDLSELTENSDVITNEMADSFRELEGYIADMQSMVEVIENISDQTSLLSLNASIEAARAGDVGRGFAVVAEEIGKLSAQTAESLESVKQKMELILESKDVVTQKLTVLEDAFAKQKVASADAQQCFVDVMQQANELENNFKGVANSVESMNEAKNTIVDSAESISAITEETTANAASTMEQTSQIENIVVNILGQVNDLAKTANELN